MLNYILLAEKEREARDAWLERRLRLERKGGCHMDPRTCWLSGNGLRKIKLVWSFGLEKGQQIRWVDLGVI